MKTQKSRKNILNSAKVQARKNSLSDRVIEINLVKNSPTVYKTNRVPAYTPLVP